MEDMILKLADLELDSYWLTLKATRQYSGDKLDTVQRTSSYSHIGELACFSRAA